jgi:hypothetical protein
MRKLLKNFLSFFLAAAIIFASTGIVIASHVCSASKKADVSLFKSNGCCSKKGKHCASFPAANTALKKNCCQLSVTFHKLDVTSLQKTFSAAHGNMVATARILFNYFPPVSAPQVIFSSHGPDLKYGGKDFLFRIHLLLI